MFFIAHLNSRYPKVVVAFWLLVFLTSLFFASRTASRLDTSGGGLPNSQAELVSKILKNDFHLVSDDTLLLVSQSKLENNNSEFLKTYQKLEADIRSIKGVKSITRFDSSGSPIALQGVVNKQNVTVSLIAASFGYPELLEKIREYTKLAQTPDLQFFITGSSAVNQDFAKYTESDVKRGEFTALPLTAIVLVFAFGALVAAGLPIIVGLFSITITLACIYAVTFFMPVSSFAQSVVTLFGLGAGIDYALLVVNRFRETLETKPDAREASFQTTLTAGRAVIFSGLTVAIAMAGLLVPNLALIRSMGVAGLLTITITVLVSVSLLPALLALLGTSVNYPKAIYRLSELTRSGAAWGRFANLVMNHPIRWALFGTTFLLLLAAPALGMKLSYTGAFGLASNVESRQGLALIRPLALTGVLDTFDVIIDLEKQDAFTSQTRAKYKLLDARFSSWNDVQLVYSPFTLVRLAAQTRANPNQSTASSLNSASQLNQAFISSNRQYLKLQIVPKQSIRTQDVGLWVKRIQLEAKNIGFERVLVGGSPQSAFEITQAIIAAIPIVVALVFLATFIVMAIAFGSILIPIKSIFLNSLSVAASYGIITMVFQNGFLANFFNAPTDTGAIDVTLPLVMFAVIFGLSMDYEIFLLTRVQEGHLAGLSTRQAVKIALERTAGVITSAALIMVIVFAGFIPGSVVVNKTIGLGLSVAVALDATIVRLILVPAFMVLAGKWNWWLPKYLRKLLPTVKLEH